MHFVRLATHDKDSVPDPEVFWDILDMMTYGVLYLARLIHGREMEERMVQKLSWRTLVV